MSEVRRNEATWAYMARIKTEREKLKVCTYMYEGIKIIMGFIRTYGGFEASQFLLYFFIFLFSSLFKLTEQIK